MRVAWGTKRVRRGRPTCVRPTRVLNLDIARTRETLSALSHRERDIVLVLSLAGPCGISQLSNLVRVARLRETASRAHSTASLRRVLAPLVENGLVNSTNLGFDCSLFARELSLRDGAARGVLSTIAKATRAEAYPELRYSYRGNAAAWFDFRVALQLRDMDKASACFAECAQLNADRFSRDNPLVQAVCAPFDATWMAGFGSRQGAVAAWTLDYANRFGLAAHGLVPWVHEHILELDHNVRFLRELLVEAAFLRGEHHIVQAQLSSPQFGKSATATAYRATLALLQGGDTEALAGFEHTQQIIVTEAGKKKGEVPLPRLCAIFHGLALLRRGTSEDLTYVARLAASRQRDKNYEFRDSAAMLKAIAETMTVPNKADLARHMVPNAKANDGFVTLLRGLFAAWFPVPAFERQWMVRACVEQYQKLLAAQHHWLADEYLWVTHGLEEALRKMPPAELGFVQGLPKLSVPPRPSKKANLCPLVALYTAKPAWQLTLQALEQLAATQKDASVIPESSGERLTWRVAPESGTIEPFLQKRTSKGWSGGRKVAVKQLLAGGAQHALLGPHDKRVAAYIREEVSSNYAGYVNREYFIQYHALLALVGHPLVFVEPEFDVPAELVRGEVRLRADAHGDKIVIKLEPPDIGEVPTLVPEAQRWVVYCLDKQQGAISQLIGEGLSIPESGKQQTLDVLGKLAKFVVVQSNEQVEAEKVEADATPWLRIVPSGTGLNVTVTVRPLGEKGPVLPVAHGAPTLVGNVNGAPLQTERNLKEEAARLDRLLDACPVLQLCEVEPGNFTLVEPEQCLELLSQLRNVEHLVHAEWPYGKPFKLRAKLGRSAFRGTLRHEAGWFLANGTLSVDSELNLELQQLVALLADGSDRFVKLDSGEYLELERELREMVDALRSSTPRPGKKSELAIPMGALASLEQLTHEQSGWQLDKTVVEWRQRFDAAFSRTIAIPRGLQAELRDYQVEGFRWLARLSELELGACLADDMGLGKTVEIIALLLRRAKQGSALVVAPTSVCNNWRLEIERFAPALRVRNYTGTSRDIELQDLKPCDVVITSYALLQQDNELLQAIDWSSVVLDEGQFIKNAETLRTKAAYGLRAPTRVVATGTPIENHPGDLYSLFRFLNPELLGSAQLFQRRFGRVTDRDDKTAARQRKELRRVIKPFILRRTKAQVLEDLPPLTEIHHTVNLSLAEAQLYEAMRKRALAKLEQTAKSPQSRVQILAELMRLRRLCCHPALVAPDTNMASSKLAAFMELVDDLLTNQHRALVFSQFVDFLTLARKMLDERNIPYQYLDGSTPQKQRATSVDAFQSGEGDLFLLSLKAGGFGLNLTGADYVIHLDPWWNPAVEQQASDRAHRIGQERPVTVYRLVTAGTIEERIVELHHRKRELANTLLEGAEDAAKISEDELLELLST